MSIDIADVDVGENIGARLQTDQAEADTRVARAKAEERRAFAFAREQEMKRLCRKAGPWLLKLKCKCPWVWPMLSESEICLAKPPSYDHSIGSDSTTRSNTHSI